MILNLIKFAWKLTTTQTKRCHCTKLTRGLSVSLKVEARARKVTAQSSRWEHGKTQSDRKGSEAINPRQIHNLITLLEEVGSGPVGRTHRVLCSFLILCFLAASR